jgi:pyruvate ferredoxin oxidoreductase delta subunit
VDEQYVPDYAFCKGCGMCANECSAASITMILEEK